MSQVSFAATKPFTDAFPGEADQQQVAFDTPSYAQVRADPAKPAAQPTPVVERPVPAVPAVEPKFHLPRNLLTEGPEPFPVLEFAVGAGVAIGVFLLVWYVVKPWISGATSTSP